MASYCVRRRGSSASRSESPKRLKPKTARLMARPGKIAIHGALSANCTAAPRSIDVGHLAHRERARADYARTARHHRHRDGEDHVARAGAEHRDDGERED